MAKFTRFDPRNKKANKNKAKSQDGYSPKRNRKSKEYESLYEQDKENLYPRPS
jgi:hypothetical protein